MLDDTTFAVLGTAHSSCAIYGIKATEPARMAQFRAWDCYRYSGEWTDEDYAHDLSWYIDPEHMATLAPRQAEVMAWWFERPVDPLPPERRESIRAAYAALIERFEREVPAS